MVEDCVVVAMVSILAAPLVVDSDRRVLDLAILAAADSATCSFVREAMCMSPLLAAVARAKPYLSTE